MLRLVGILLIVVGLANGCRRADEARAAQAPAARVATSQAPADPAGPPPPEIQAAVQGVLDTGRHPGLSRPELTGVLPDLEALYAVEPDGLVWFAGEVAHPALGRALETIARCDTHGLNPADYDAARLAAAWDGLKSGASPTERALFDVAASVSVMRLLESVHWGRVDPRLVGFDYDVTSRRLDLATGLRAARDGDGLAAAVAAAAAR